MNLSRFQTLCGIVFLVLSQQIAIEQVFAQETTTTTNNSIPPMSTLPNAPQDFFSFGLSYQQSVGAPYFSLQLSPMFSALYAHKFSSWLEVEAAVHFTGRSNSSNVPFGSSMSLAQTFDISAMITPFAESKNGLERLRIGGGVSLQNGTFTGTGAVANPQGVWELRDIFSSYQRWGANLKLEYLMPISSNVDIGLRAQAYIFSDPLLKQGNYTVVGRTSLLPTVSIGGFIRFGW